MKIDRILVSQPRPAVAEKSPYNDIHTRFGIGIDYRPFIKVEGVSLKEFRSQRTEILDHTAVIFTSRTTIDHFFRIADEARVTIPETMKYICNTEATALYLQKYIIYRKRKIFFADGSFKNLMELIIKHRDERYLLVLSEPHKPELPETLEKMGLKFSKVILSRTVSADLGDLDVAAYDMMVFFSPSEIVAFRRRIDEGAPLARMPRIATFGDSTTRAAIDCGFEVSVMAPTVEAPSMAKAIELYVQRIEKGEEPALVKLADNNVAEDFVKSHESRSVRRKSTPK